MAVSKVLVVDDAEADRVALEQILSEAGYQVVCAASGAEALDKAASDRPDLVLLDVVMDELDGFKTCRELSTNPDTSAIPVIMVSGNTQKVNKIWAEQQGAKAYITKPYTADQILDEVQRFS
jgi:twitching motility two-component system response regulator PilH